MKRFLGLLTIIVTISIMFLFLTSCSGPMGSTSTSGQKITQAIDTGSWTFTATMVRPQFGGSRQPNGFYTVIFSPGNLNVYLPYFGRTFGTADVLDGDNPLNFISKDFQMKKELIKQGKWRISFVPKDKQRQVQNLVFVIFENGNATLDVTMTSRTPISYNGSVTATKP